MSGPGHAQRVARTQAYTPSQMAYHDYVMHAGTCPGCELGRCETAEELWQVYEQARDEGPRL